MWNNVKRHKSSSENLQAEKTWKNLPSAEIWTRNLPTESCFHGLYLLPVFSILLSHQILQGDFSRRQQASFLELCHPKFNKKSYMRISILFIEWANEDANVIIALNKQWSTFLIPPFSSNTKMSRKKLNFYYWISFSWLILSFYSYSSRIFTKRALG